MTKVIAGTYKGRDLKVPKSVTRPTSSRVREATFSAIEHMLGEYSGIRILDLYAGSGANAIEAISRGASEAVAIEKDSRATTVIKSNCLQLGIESLRVISMDVPSALQGGPQFGQFDLVFMDPPYSLSDPLITTELELLANNWLTDGAVVMVERNKKSAFEIPDCYTEIRKKVYGDTLVWYGHFDSSKVNQER